MGRLLVGSSTFGDHYSKQSQDYARFRPTYPPALYEFVVGQCGEREFAWDCGAGNGQVACCLADHFSRVLATEPSAEQLSHARAHPRVEYRQTKAEVSGIAAKSVDLIAAGSAVHWFDIPAFYQEVRRVAKPGAVIALWTYAPLLLGDSPLSEWIGDYAQGTVGEHWPSGKHLFFGEYKTLDFPFDEIETPPMELPVNWSLEQLYGWVTTWSATVLYEETLGHDPLEGAKEELLERWPVADGKTTTLRLPIYWRVGRL